MSDAIFTVIDTRTGSAPDLEAIALHEAWAHGLIYCDMEGFSIEEDGTLMLADECGNFRYPPEGRFRVVWSGDQALRDERDRLRGLLQEIAFDCEHVGSIQHLDKAERRTWVSVANRIKAALTPADQRHTPSESTE